MNDNKKISARNGFKDISLLLDRLIMWVDARGWAKKNPIIITGALIFLSIITALPNYSHFQTAGDELWHTAIKWKFEHPLLPIPVKQMAAEVHDEKNFTITNLEKKSYRVLVPLLAHALGFGETTARAIQQGLACLFLLLTLLVFYQIFADKLSALFAGAMVAVSFPGQWGFSDFFAFDGYAYFFIILAVWTSSPWVVGCAIFAGGLTDERVIMATPLVWLWIGVRAGCVKENFNVKNLIWPQASHFGLLIGIALFLMVRVFLALKWGVLYNSSDIGDPFKKCLHFLPTAFLLGVKGGILVFFAATMILIARRKFALLILATCAIIPSLITALMVYDLARSLCYAFPALFIAMAVLAKRCSVDECRKILFCALLGCLFFQTCYVGPFNIKLLNY
jgi:hypothetical protein